MKGLHMLKEFEFVSGKIQAAFNTFFSDKQPREH